MLLITLPLLFTFSRFCECAHSSSSEFYDIDISTDLSVNTRAPSDPAYDVEPRRMTPRRLSRPSVDFAPHRPVTFRSVMSDTSSLFWNLFNARTTDLHLRLDYFCVYLNCGLSLFNCLADKICEMTLVCLQGCNEQSLSEKCTIRCLLKEKHNSEMANLMKCMTSPQKFYPKSCLIPGTQKKTCEYPLVYEKAVSLADLEGNWYVIRGLNSIYDCWDCQTIQILPQMPFIFSDAIEDSEWTIKNKFDIGNAQLRSSYSTITHQLPEVYDGRFQVNHTIANFLQARDNWIVLAMSSDIALIYYCGLSEISEEYAGAIVISKSPMTTITPSQNQWILSALHKSELDLDYKVFCHNVHFHCQNHAGTRQDDL